MINTENAIKKINSGEIDKILLDSYVDENLLDKQHKRYIASIKKYEEHFGTGDIEIYSTPGRSEVCGNHTDHQHGMVLATAVNLDTIAVVGYNQGTIKLISEGYKLIEIKVNELDSIEAEKGTSNALIRGTLRRLKDLGYEIGGFNAYVTSDVLVGAGLSSSAAFEVIIGTILSGLYNEMSIDAVEIAKIAKYAENVYFDKPSGLMDQMACSVGGLINIDFKKSDEPVVRHIDADLEGYSLCIIDTKGSHEDLTDEYATIPSEMKSVAEYFGKDYLREVKKKDFYESISNIRTKLSDRAVLRAIHYYNEHEHVKLAVDALTNNDIEKFLDVIRESGNTSYKYLQNVYSTKDVTEQNLSVAIGVSENILGGNGVCRVHGGGFAGTIQAFVKNEFVDEYKEKMDKIFGMGSCHILKIRKYGGLKVI